MGNVTGAGQPGQQLQEAQWVTELKNWWSRVGAFTRFIAYAGLATYLMSWIFFTYIIDFYLINFPTISIGGFQIWRLLTTPFVHLGLLQLIFSMLVYLPEGAKNEREAGTLANLIDFSYLNLQIQIIYSLVCLFFGIFMNVRTWHSICLWPVYMAYLTRKCMRNPEQPVPLLCFPIQIPSKWYPLTLILIFSFMSNMSVASFPFDLLIAVGVGYLHHMGLVPQLTISKERLTAFERMQLVKWFQDRSNFISVNSAGAGQAGSFRPQPYNQPEGRQGGQGAQQPQAPPVQPFYGRGVAIGSSNEVRNQQKQHDEESGGDHENPHSGKGGDDLLGKIDSSLETPVSVYSIGDEPDEKQVKEAKKKYQEFNSEDSHGGHNNDNE